MQIHVVATFPPQGTMPAWALVSLPAQEACIAVALQDAGASSSANLAERHEATIAEETPSPDEVADYLDELAPETRAAIESALMDAAQGKEVKGMRRVECNLPGMLPIGGRAPADCGCGSEKSNLGWAALIVAGVGLGITLLER